MSRPGVCRPSARREPAGRPGRPSARSRSGPSRLVVITGLVGTRSIGVAAIASEWACDLSASTQVQLIMAGHDHSRPVCTGRSHSPSGFLRPGVPQGRRSPRAVSAGSVPSARVRTAIEGPGVARVKALLSQVGAREGALVMKAAARAGGRRLPSRIVLGCDLERTALVVPAHDRHHGRVGGRRSSASSASTMSPTVVQPRSHTTRITAAPRRPKTSSTASGRGPAAGFECSGASWATQARFTSFSACVPRLRTMKPTCPRCRP